MKSIVLNMLKLPIKIKFFLVFSSDIMFCALSIWIAYSLRLDNFGISTYNIYWLYTVLITSICGCVFFYFFGIYKISLRYLSLQSIIKILLPSIITAVLFAIISICYNVNMPRSVPIIFTLVFFGLCSASRIIIRLLYLYSYLSHKICRTLIYGAGDSGRQLAVALQNSNACFPVAFIDDDQNRKHRTVLGLHVYPSSSLQKIIEQKKIHEVLLAMPELSQEKRRKIIESLTCFDVKIFSLPDVSELAQGKGLPQQLREVSLEDLLGRSPIPPNNDLLKRNIEHRAVLVTGAGGSIGSELCRQIVKYKAHRLILFDISEAALYTITQELRQKYTDTITEIIPIIGNIQNENHILQIFTSFKIETVYHAAAYKHVPMVEYNIAQAIINNIFGTVHCVNAAIKSNVKHFVFISTDKAVRPTNIMGATKRVSEMVLQVFAGAREDLVLSMVRFGNVLGSSGSVIPLFRRQIAEGGPLTVTHPDIRRYFMTIPEAVELVIQAGAMGKNGDVFVLDMGKPVKIIDLAQKMIKLSGMTIRDNEHPQGDIAISFRGLRPGEKLFEELLLEGSFEVTEHPKIMRKHEVCLSKNELLILLENMKDALARGDAIMLRKLLQLPEIAFTPESSIKDLLWQRNHQSCSTHCQKVSL